MSSNKLSMTQPTHAPGKGSDKEHPETPPDANKKFREAEQRELEEQEKNRTTIPNK